MFSAPADRCSRDEVMMAIFIAIVTLKWRIIKGHQSVSEQAGIMAKKVGLNRPSRPRGFLSFFGFSVASLALLFVRKAVNQYGSRHAFLAVPFTEVVRHLAFPGLTDELQRSLL